MTFSRRIEFQALLASAAVAALVLGACQKQTDLAADQTTSTAAASDQVAANTASGAQAADASASAETSAKTIAEVAGSQSQFSTLMTAAKAAGLDDELAAPGPITVFAPTDAAFAALPPGKLDDLMKPENKAQLAALLKHHIVAGEVTSDQLQGATSEASMNGALAVNASNPNQVKVADANVVGPDIKTSNGVIHVVDKVLLPAT